MDPQFNSQYMSYHHQNHSAHSQATGAAPYAAAQQRQPSSQSQQQHESPLPTLPPLQSQNGFFAPLPFAGSGVQTPTTPHTPHTPHTPASASMTNAASNAMPHLSPAASMGPPQSFNTASYPLNQPLNSIASSSNGLPTIRPMPPTSSGMSASLSALPSLTTTGHTFVQNEEAPTHVVGQQGRRGILPSAPGRPVAASSSKPLTLQKDADGKFPCQHCNKTYLHAKHLKRHMLRREYLEKPRE